MKKLSYYNPAGNERGSKTVSTVLAVAIVGVFVALLAYAFLGVQSPLRMVFNKKSFDYDRTQQRANALLQTGEYEKAKAEFEKLIEMNPEKPVPIYKLGMACAKLGYADEAVNHFKRSIELKPDFAEARASLATMYLRFGQQELELMNYPKARDYLRQAALEIQTALSQNSEQEDFQAIHKAILETENKLPEQEINSGE